MNARSKTTLAEFDVSDLIGLNVVVVNAAREVTDDIGDTTIELDDMETLEAAAAIVRCMMPVRLLGSELRCIRKIAGMSASDLASKMGEKTSPETISRWENGKQPMGGYAEKVFRLIACEALRDQAPAVGYKDGVIANLIQIDPWRADPDYKLPPIVMRRVLFREVPNTEAVEAWETKAAA